MRYYLISLGCPKNTVDAECMSQLLQAAGYKAVDKPTQADILIVNTCGFIGPAIQESVGTLLKLARVKRPGQRLIAAGCLPERVGSWLNQVPELDGLLSTRRWMDIVALVEAVLERRPGQPPQELPPGSLESPGPGFVPRQVGPSAYLKIADGCSAPCAFCTIPAIKGPARSRPQAELLAEARYLVNNGVQELILIAQDTTAYGRDWGEGDALPDLIQAILKTVPELRWLRLMYAYPQHVTSRLIEVMASHPQVCHYLDLPLQHAHPDVLRRMRRPSVETVYRLLAALRAAMPDIALRTTFIVGYPGETEAEFQTLLDFMAEVRFDKVGIFTYCQEEGTPAAILPGQLDAVEKEARYRRAMSLQQTISRQCNQAQIGRTLEVLIEGVGDGYSVGRSYRDAPEIDGLVFVKGHLPVGQFTTVTITGALEYDLVGSQKPSKLKQPRRSSSSRSSSSLRAGAAG